MNLMKLTKVELLQKCEDLGITKCKSKNKSELVELILSKSTSESEESISDDSERVVPEKKTKAKDPSKEAKPKRKTGANKIKEGVLPAVVEETFTDSPAEDETAETPVANVTVRPKRKPVASKKPKDEPSSDVLISEETPDTEPVTKPKRKPITKKTVESPPLKVNEEEVPTIDVHEEPPSVTLTDETKEEVNPSTEEEIDTPNPEETEFPSEENKESNPSSITEELNESSSNDSGKKRREVDIVVNMSYPEFQELAKTKKTQKINKLIKNKLYYIDNCNVSDEEHEVIFGRFIRNTISEDKIPVATFKNVNYVIGEEREIDEIELSISLPYVVYSA